ncbi:MAG: 5'/3'-nucleotidase SurE [Alphaproteobacteria bacterium]
MAERPIPDRRIDVETCRILISNDDGIESPGIKILEQVARELSNDVWVVAPDQEQSGASHSLTTRRPLRLIERSERHYAVDGTPTDCVLLAVKKVLRERPPDLVLSGINGGSNAGEDMTYSGTVAAAMEAALLGIPAIALSQEYPDGSPIPWDTSKTLGAKVIRRLLKQSWPANLLVNVNFPGVPADRVAGFAVTRQGKRDIAENLTEGSDPRGRPYYWIGPIREVGDPEPGTDIAALTENKVSITPVNMDLTYIRQLDPMRRLFE